MSRLVVISPHLDDAVFSCGSLIAASALTATPLIVTVCAGIPQEGILSTLDAQAGFTSSADAMRARRAEDVRAALILGAEVLHLDVLCQNYADADHEQREREIERALLPTLFGGGTLIGPVGIRHADHIAVAVACEHRVEVSYAELPYRALWPELVRPLPYADLLLPSCEAKARAILCYRSQLGDGPPGHELSLAERYYRNRP